MKQPQRERNIHTGSFFLRLMTILLGEKIVNPPQNEEEDVSPAQQTEPRIVSKTEYAAMLCRKAAFCVGGIGAGCAATACAVTCILVYRYLMMDNRLPGWWLGAALLCGSGACFLFSLAIKWLQRSAEKVNTVVLTNDVVDALLFPDSLVRASEEPVQTQEAVLLRARLPQQQESGEQLLRAAIDKR